MPAALAWDAALDRQCQAIVEKVCDPAASPADRGVAWKRLLLLLGPHLEQWCRQCRLLRRAGLATEDDARSVLVLVVTRLARDDFDNLRRWISRQRLADDAEQLETDAIERIVRLSGREAAEAAAGEANDGLASSPANGDTPLRGWLLNLLRFVAKDHVKQRLGWAEPTTDAPADKRDLGTNAERMDMLSEAGVRPPMTDMLALRRLIDQMRSYVETFPAPMRHALDLWMRDASFEEIASELGLESPAEGRALARAAQARLRERFRDQWPQIRVGGA